MNNPFPAIATDLRETVDRAQTLLAELSDAQTNQGSQPGKWTKKEILGHLLDSASNNHQRFVRAALQGDLVFPGYDQEGLVALQRFGDLQWRFLVEFWAGYNRFLAHVIRNAFTIIWCYLRHRQESAGHARVDRTGLRRAPQTSFEPNPRSAFLTSGRRTSG